MHSSLTHSLTHHFPYLLISHTLTHSLTHSHLTGYDFDAATLTRPHTSSNSPSNSLTHSLTHSHLTGYDFDAATLTRPHTSSNSPSNSLTHHKMDIFKLHYVIKMHTLLQCISTVSPSFSPTYISWQMSQVARKHQ
jgi:hypothetical protein